MKDNILEELTNISKNKKANGVSIGKKETNGAKTDEVAVCFYVSEKKDVSELSPEELIPSEIEIDGKTYKTDVKVRPEVEAMPCYFFFGDPVDPEIARLRGDPFLLDPLKGGQEITEFPTGWTYDGMNFGRVVGTLGFFAVDNTDDRVVGVTNTHVAVNKILKSDERNITDDGEPYNTLEDIEWTFPDLGFITNGDSYPPGALVFEGSTPFQGAQRLKRHAPFSLIDTNYVDACLLVMEPARVDADSYQIHQPTTEPAFTDYLPFASTAEIDALLTTGIPTAVYSTGRTTGPKGWGAATDCQLEVTGLVASIFVNFSGIVVEFTDVIEYEYVDGSAGPAAGGDSGSALQADIGGVRKIIGVVFAGSNNFGLNTGTAFAIRIDRLADELNIRAWDNSYVLDTSVPTPEIQVVVQGSEFSDNDTLVDSDGDTVYQMGMTTQTGYPEFTPQATPTVTPTLTPSVTPTISVTPTQTVTPSVTPATSPTVTPTATVTPTVTASVTPTATVTPTVTPTISVTPTITPTVTPSATPPAALATGYTAGGNPVTSTIQSFPFAAPFTTATSVGNLTSNKLHGSGQSSSDDGYSSGGQVTFPSPTNSTIDRFPFSTPFVTATDIGDLSAPKAEAAGQSSSTDGYSSTGDPSGLNIIDRFPFSTPFITATDIGNVSDTRAYAGGSQSSSDGYTHGGWAPGSSTVIDRFPFSTPFVTATDIGNLTTGRYGAAGSSSTTDGYCVAGGSLPSSNQIERYPFSAPFTTATNIGDLLVAGYYRTGVFGSTDGFSAGAQPTTDTIENFPFSSPFTTSTDIGNLATAISRAGSNGNQV